MATVEGLIAFEAEVAAAFEAKKIRGPVHLVGGNEERLIDIFQFIKPTDWVLSTWRSHYHALLKITLDLRAEASGVNVEHYENLQMRKTEAEGTAGLFHVSQRFDEEMEKDPSVDSRTKKERQLPELCGGVFAARQDQESGVSKMRDRIVGDASPGLQQATKDIVALSSVPFETARKIVMRDILAGKSMQLHYPEHHFLTSAIVGGICPIAVGLAAAAQKVYCFVGDMAAETGIFHECVKYAEGHDLPVTFIIEDNGYATNTPTAETWGTMTSEHVYHYSYERTMPHCGVGQFVQF